MLNAESAEADMLAGEAQDELKNHGGAIEQFRDVYKRQPEGWLLSSGLNSWMANFSSSALNSANPRFKRRLGNAGFSAMALR